MFLLKKWSPNVKKNVKKRFPTKEQKNQTLKKRCERLAVFFPAARQTQKKRSENVKKTLRKREKRFVYVWTATRGNVWFLSPACHFSPAKNSDQTLKNFLKKT